MGVSRRRYRAMLERKRREAKEDGDINMLRHYSKLTGNPTVAYYDTPPEGSVRPDAPGKGRASA